MAETAALRMGARRRANDMTIPNKSWGVHTRVFVSNISTCRGDQAVANTQQELIALRIDTKSGYVG